MTAEVMAVVLFSALLHASWNALVRSSADKLLSTLQVVCGAAVLALVLLPALPAPATASWPYLLASGLIHVVYFTLVAYAYRGADLSYAYPLMRGSAPVLSALAAVWLLGEQPSAAGWFGIGLICAGVLSLAGGSWRSGLRHPQATASALGNALIIMLYTVVDGQGARLSGHAFSYTAWVFVLTAPPMLALAAVLRGRGLRQARPGALRHGLLGGAGTLGAYSLVLWAMAHAPIAAVAALRETSIVFAALIGAVFLREHISRLRLFAIALVCAGAVALKLA
ncbi:MAG: EamA family transporter [Burkholderiales bacterium]|nr:EamA family transporter [Burkholderiales bacterium]